MTPVIKAVYQPTDPRYPFVFVGPNWWEKMTREEVIQLVDEMLDAVNQYDSEYKEAA